MSLTRDAILSTDRARLKEVKVPEWQGSVYVRPLLLRDRALLTDAADPPLAAILARVMCDEHGTLLFRPDDPADVALIDSLAVDGCLRVFQAVNEQSGLGDSGVEVAKGN